MPGQQLFLRSLGCVHFLNLQLCCCLPLQHRTRIMARRVYRLDLFLIEMIDSDDFGYKPLRLAQEIGLGLT
jgi:hypothetical protein